MNDIMEQAQETFITESLELLSDMESSLNQLASDPADNELINSVFRTAHTIKGSAGLFGFDGIVSFTHKVENMLDRVRDGEVAITAKMIAVLLDCRDHIEGMIEQVGSEGDEPATQARSQKLLVTLQDVGEPDRAPSDSAEQVLPSMVTTVADVSPLVKCDAGLQVSNDNWHISLRFHPDVLRNGMDPLSFLRYLATQGDIINVMTLSDSLPAAAEMDPETCYIGLEIVFNSDCDKQIIMDVFEFIAEDSHVYILPPQSKVSEYSAHIDKLITVDGHDRIGDLLLEIGALTVSEQKRALETQQAGDKNVTRKPIGEILVDQGSVHPETIDEVLKQQKTIKARKTKESTSIRVDAERLDQLINLVGELVIAGAGTNLLAQQVGSSELLESSFLISRLVEEIRDRALRLRMVQIGDTFNRFNRVVRDASRDMDKSINLVIEGSDTELDKSVVEKIGDPLTHLVRNAIDHGIESAEERLARGKPENGTVTLNAYHDSGSIVIEVSDDGGGIDPDKVLRKAIEKGLVTADQQLSRPEILRLILEAGLTTKEEVSNLSGRGVGMDVVKRNVELLRGSIEVDSELGVGTSLRVHLPLTLSIIDGFLVGVGDASYVIPLDSVVECIEHRESQHHLQHNGDYVNLRGEVLPFLNLRDLFQEQSEAVQRKNIVVVQCGGQKAGLVVDALLGEYQTVIKPLSAIFSKLSGISGSTILGSGDVAMILDVPALLKQSE
tara:strand:- start:5325 stop:7502 length:2178 start_codon:yes stop_codon:yes gene_type:complete